MAPLPVIPGVHRVALQWQSPYFTRHAVNVMHFLDDGASAATVRDKLAAHVTATMWGQTSTDTGVIRTVVTPLDGSAASLVTDTGRPVKWSGTQSVDNQVPQACVLASVFTGVRGRSFRGRAYLPFPCETAITNGSIGSSLQTSMQSAWTAFLNAMLADGCGLVVASYKHATQALATAVSIEQLLATQRLRQPRPS